MTAAPEKSAPIPADGPRGADVQQLADRCAQAVYSSIGRRDITKPIKEAIVDAIRADREARPSLPDSGEERIREDEREACIELASQYCWTRYKDRPPAHLREPAVFTSHEWHKIADAMRAERQKADRARQGGNNG